MLRIIMTDIILLTKSNKKYFWHFLLYVIWDCVQYVGGLLKTNKRKFGVKRKLQNWIVSKYKPFVCEFCAFTKDADENDDDAENKLSNHCNHFHVRLCIEHFHREIQIRQNY